MKNLTFESYPAGANSTHYELVEMDFTTYK
jgi:hypothetical protein